MANAAVVTELRGDDKDLQRALKKSESSIEKFGKTATRAFKLIAAAIVVERVLAFGRAMLQLAATQEKAEAKLESVIRATGQAAGFTTDQLKLQAAALQSMTTVGDEVIINMQAVLATFKEIKGDNFIKAEMAILDMAEVLDTDLKGAAIQVGKALNDPIKGIAALSRSGVSFTEEQKEMIRSLQESGDMMGAQAIILKELSSEFGGAAKDAANTFSGQMEQMQNRIGDVGESIGKMLIPALQAMNPLLEAAVTAVENMVPVMATWIESMVSGGQAVFEFLKPALEWMRDVGVGIFTGFQIVVENWGESLRAVAIGFELAFIRTFENVRHWLTVTMPTLLSWFGRNWASIFTDIWKFTSTVFANMWKNISSFFKNSLNWLRGKKTDWKWTGLLDGFESTLEELPKIQKRVIGMQEKILQQELDKTNAKLAEQFEDRFKRNRDALLELFKKNTTEVDAEAAKIEKILAADPKTAAPKIAEAIKEVVDEVKKEDKKEQKKEEEEFQASIESLEALNARISAAAAGEADKQLAEAKKGNEINQRVVNGVMQVKDGIVVAAKEIASLPGMLSEKLKGLGALK